MIETPRLILRPWRGGDLPLFAGQNGASAVMRLRAGGLRTWERSDAHVARAMAHLADGGFCKWAAEAPGVAPFVGAVGMTRVRFEAAWRLHRRWWGRGGPAESAWGRNGKRAATQS